MRKKCGGGGGTKDEEVARKWSEDEGRGKGKEWE